MGANPDLLMGEPANEPDDRASDADGPVQPAPTDRIPASVSVSDIEQDERGRLWIGTTSGLFVLDPATGNLERYVRNPDNPDGLSHSGIMDIVRDPSGVLWFGTAGGGLNKLNPRSQPFRHTLEDPEFAGQTGPGSIWALLPGEDGTVWIGSMGRGVLHFDPVSGRADSHPLPSAFGDAQPFVAALLDRGDFDLGLLVRIVTHATMLARDRRATTRRRPACPGRWRASRRARRPHRRRR